ncbi:MAG TPA: response regulator [Gemmatimonadales bacterium]|nr:response regulator [Gemmatimonadales bacterium]
MSAPLDLDAKHLVLVVDDEPVVRRYAARVLLSAGYEVHEAGDGQQALDFLEGRAGAVDVVVSDIVMPRLNGVELLETLSRAHPDLPVILMSGYGPAELAQRGIAAPCALLGKPFPPEKLVAEVQRCIRENAT